MSDTHVTGTYAAASGGASMIGAVLGNYRITDALSAGGMGSVYRAQHELLDRPAAIKLLRPELTTSDELVQRFFNEAKAVTAIRHPGIVEVYDFGYTDDGHAYLVMELLDGAPLSRVIADHPFAEREAAAIVRAIASALKAAHAKGIIHRDLKPDNVFLIPDPDGREPRIKVLDFGIAKLANPPPSDRRHTQTGVLMGTPRYMAPEQAREAAAIDHRADLYSLGCIFYELLVGQPPFVAEGAGEIIALQLFAEPEPPSKRAQVSPEIEEIVIRLLEKEPGARFQSAAELMDALVAIGVRISTPAPAITVDSRSLRVPSNISHLDTLPSIPAGADTVRSPAPVAPPKRTWSLPLLVGGLALAVAAGTIAFFLSRGDDASASRATPPAPVAGEPAAPATPPPAAAASPPSSPASAGAAPASSTAAAAAAGATPPAPAVATSPAADNATAPASAAAPAAPASAKGARPDKRGKPREARPDRMYEVVPIDRSPPPPPSPPTRPTTDQGSPIYTTLEDPPKKAP